MTEDFRERFNIKLRYLNRPDCECVSDLMELHLVVNDRIARIAQGKSVVHVQAAELSKIEITYPDPFSQKTIIAILAAISDRIDQSNAELTLSAACRLPGNEYSEVYRNK